jgi:hypothetical protein
LRRIKFTPEELRSEEQLLLIPIIHRRRLVFTPAG